MKKIKLKDKVKDIISNHKWLRFVLPLSLVLLVSILGLSLIPNEAEAPKAPAFQNTAEPESKIEINDSEAKELDIKSPTSQFVLVNKKNPLEPLDYRPADLVASVVPTSSSDSSDERSVREIIKANLVRMFADAKVADLDLIMNSGFRSNKLQAFYYNNYVKNSGVDAANKFSAKPGYSEHQTGLAFDVSYANRKCYLEVCFAETDAGKWLKENAHKYGFILRYPEGKESITGYQFEPWHFRYVGKEVAKEVFEKQITYEEYLAELNLIVL